MKTSQQGMTTVEFSLIAGLVMIVLFGVIEVARAFFVWNTIAEATRRGARVATVCPVNHPAIARITIFGEPDGGDSSPILSGLSAGNVTLNYLDNGGVATATFADIAYVRVGITNYQHTLLIPFVGQTLEVPAFSTTLPAESLGYIPDLGTRECFGV
ncbi:TadE/TadG family type IV pilus assembly protein [Nitrosococcus wardiae]|uniref:Pilus assembly protein n=1 Tax=Nitrosococcus wardiae TaxID=1814290 RepID=A0A4V1AW97_9GAMM|nr:TadE/TadG family type IV pilus assembly protein [Nitrosococcus wardiae]QBQ55875.1 pilus assembly protein [Nitrosococcus wardiae]